MKFIKYFFSKCTHARTCLNKRGQAAVLYALLTPIFLLFIGVTFDLGWYYLNVSRLQNAADSAAVAGAQTILESKNENFSSYKSVTLVKNYPGDEEHVYNVSDISAEEVIGDSNGTAADYASKNLSRNAGWMLKGDDYVMMDAWSQDAATEVTMNPSIYQKDDELYYVIKLEEQIRHFFLPGWFDFMNAPVTAVAMISKSAVSPATLDLDSITDNPQAIHIKPTPVRDDYAPDVMEEILAVIPRVAGAGAEGGLPEGTNILAEMYKIEDVSVTRNWEWQAHATDEEYKKVTMGGTKYKGKWNEYQDKRDNERRVHYKNGDLYRTEIVEVYAGSKDETKSTTSSGGFSESELDSINLDFHPDVKYVFKEDWDIGYTPPGNKTLAEIQNDRSSKKDYDGNYDLRIHSTFNFDTPYNVRSTYSNKTTNPEDVLYVRIEAEPITPMQGVTKNGESYKIKNEPQEVFSTVRQIILNINKSTADGNDSYNMAKNDKGEYIHRPLMFFYSGPEKIDNNSHVRDSQPVILNLNADARVILFAPNSPVVICGNEHRMQGFVIAKSFVRLTNDSDYIKNGSQYLDKEDPSKVCFKIYENHENNNPTMFIDSKGNVQTKPVVADSNNLRDPIYENDLEKPLDTGVITYPAYEKVYKMHTAFNIDKGDYERNTSFYDSFRLFDKKGAPTGSLKRDIYTYLDAYIESDKNEFPNSVDMFFTKIRSSWVN